jgi:hypothetical protein
MEQKYSYSWQSVLQEAVLEINPEKLRAKVQHAEVAIFERAQALSLFDRGNFGRGNWKEQQAIDEALSKLEELRKNKLAFPD